MLEFAALLSACVLARWHSVITGNIKNFWNYILFFLIILCISWMIGTKLTV